VDDARLDQLVSAGLLTIEQAENIKLEKGKG
jgi:hypothetical protein